METIGEHLKRVRETCGYSLEDVARATKINPRYLSAIENDEFAKIPGEIFLQGFLRSYARFLGIEEREIIGRLKDRRSEVPHTEFHIQAVKFEEKRKGISLLSGKWKLLISLGGGILALLIVIILFAGGHETTSIESSKEADEVGKVHKVSVEKEIREDSAKTSPVKEVHPLRDVQSREGSLSLRLKAKELTWVQIDIDGKGKKEALLRPGDEVLYTGEETIGMTIGNAGGVDAVINGKMEGPFGKSGEVIRGILITKKGVVKGGAGGSN